jgi:hypothetical protein
VRDFREGTAEEEELEGELFGSQGQSAYKIGSREEISNSFNKGASPKKKILY